MKWIKKYRYSVLCLVVAAVLYGALTAADKTSQFSSYPYLEREGYGQGEKQYLVEVEGLAEEAVSLDIAVENRIYGEQEIAEKWPEYLDQIKQLMLGENESLSQVKTNLNLIKRLEEEGLELSWETENREIINGYGELWEDGLPEDVSEKDAAVGLETSLFLNMSDGVNQRQYEIPVCVAAKEEEQSIRQVQALEEKIRQADREQQKEEGVLLPKEFEGKSLTYRMEKNDDNIGILLLGLIASAAAACKDKEEERKKLQIRKKQMMMDYSEIVSKLQILLGAGMTARNAWERVVMDYEAMAGKEMRKRRDAYEEMSQTYYQIKSGISEGEAYRNFGRRCCLQPYMKLSSLLEQNRKTGTKNLKQLLDIEVRDAFEQRKHMAKRMGEEASTKLLIPLFLMLGIVMAIIAAPAVMTFSA